MFEENKEICRRLLEQGYGKGDLKAVEETVSTKCRLHDPAFPDLQPGSDNLKQHIRGLRDAFPNLSCSCDDVIAERDEVVIHWTCRGAQRGEFMGHAATNRSALVTGTSIFRLANGRIAELWSDWNVQSLLDQLGMGMTGQEANKALVSRFLEEVWNRRKPNLIDQFVSEDCIRTTPTGTVKGASGYRKDYDAFATAFPNLHLKIEEITCDAERVVVRFTATGTQEGRLRDQVATGRSVTFSGLSLYRVVQGKIVEQHLAYDQLGLLQQLGAVQDTSKSARGTR